MLVNLVDKDTATVSSKGQITIPKHIRDELRLEAGAQMQFVRTPRGSLEILPRTGRVEDLFGILHDPSIAPMTIDEMNEAAAQGAAASGMRGMESHDAPEWEEETWEQQ